MQVQDSSVPRSLCLGVIGFAYFYNCGPGPSTTTTLNWSVTKRSRVTSQCPIPAPVPPAYVAACALTAWCCRVSSLRVFLLSSACTRICSLFSCSTAASYSYRTQAYSVRLTLPTAHSMMLQTTRWQHQRPCQLVHVTG